MIEKNREKPGEHMKHISQKAIRVLALLLLLALIAGLGYAVVNTYAAYTQMVVAQQQQYLLITARAVAQNLSLYISKQLRDVNILVRTPGFMQEFRRYYTDGDDAGLKEYILSFILSQQQGVSRIYLLDRDAKLICVYNQYPLLENFSEELLHLDTLAERRWSGVGSVFRVSDRHYGLTVSNAVSHGDEFLGTVVTVVDLETVYQQYIAPLNIQTAGDIIVKNARGTVIMHPETKMLTFNPFRDIADLNTLPQYESLRNMLDMQYSREEGTVIYRTYSNGILPPQDEIAAFSRMNEGGATWYVSAVLPYSSVKRLIDQNVGQFGILVATILTVLAAAVLVFYAMRKNQQRLELESSYLREMNHTLEELHQSREQVYHYQKLQTIGALTGGIVHEFNNLLTPIMGYSEFLKERMGPESEYYEDMDEIFKAGTRAKEIIDQLLPFSRRETDSSAYGPVSLEAVLRDVTRMVSMILPASIRLETDFADLHANVFGSATQLHQVFLNLCSNAVQAMEPDGGVLTIRARRPAPDALPAQLAQGVHGDCVCVTVSDTGCGIAPETLPHIFDTFFTTKQAGEGTGLGLSVVQNILISHGGCIEARSTPGKGSEFLVFLPLTALAVPARPPKAPPAAEASGAGPILLVDDDERVARYLSRRLRRAGYTVDLFTDSEQALAAFSRTPGRWDLVLADNTMPKYKGTALIQRIRVERPQTAVILMTGLVERDAIQMRQEGLIDEIFIKPLDFAKLSNAIWRLLHPEDPDV